MKQRDHPYRCQSKPLQLLLSGEHEIFMHCSAILNYSIASHADGGSVSSTAQGELCGVNPVPSQAVLVGRTLPGVGGRERLD